MFVVEGSGRWVFVGFLVFVVGARVVGVAL